MPPYQPGRPGQCQACPTSIRTALPTHPQHAVLADLPILLTKSPAADADAADRSAKLLCCRALRLTANHRVVGGSPPAWRAAGAHALGSFPGSHCSCGFDLACQRNPRFTIKPSRELRCRVASKHDVIGAIPMIWIGSSPSTGHAEHLRACEFYDCQACGNKADERVSSGCEADKVVGVEQAAYVVGVAKRLSRRRNDGAFPPGRQAELQQAHTAF